MTLDRHRMGDAHESWLVSTLGGRRTPGSGNQWRNPMDGRHNRYGTPFAFAWDGKSTMGESISVTKKMLAKAREQADAERPMIALRFYEDERLRHFDDWFLVRADDFLEMRNAACPDPYDTWDEPVEPRGYIPPPPPHDPGTGLFGGKV